MNKNIPNFIKYCSILFIGLLSLTNHVEATHNRAGQIIVEQIGDLTIRATIITYTKTSSTPADRDSLEIDWGDGFQQIVLRSNGGGSGEPLENNIKFNTYIAEHTYPGRGTYTISMEDPNRNAGILNVNPPSSDNVPFYLETVYTFFNPQFNGYNSTPRLLQPPIDIGFVGQPFIHNPNAFDLDGDSIAYELVEPLQTAGFPVPNYSFPDQIGAGIENQIELNPFTGDFIWDAPQVVGEYNIAILIKEYRDGQLISTMIRDMQINVLEGDNLPPEIETMDEFCIVAGDTLEFNVTATDPDIGQKIKLTALGGPLEVTPSPATFTVPSGFQDPSIVGVFKWIPPCEVISDQFYQVIFRAVDDYEITNNMDTFGLATLKSVRIKVVGPAPEDVTAVADENEVTISWESPYACESTLNDYFQGFSIWRRNGSNQFPIDTCETGLAGKGYTRIAFGKKDLSTDGRYFYVDTSVETGRTYCYRILAEFAQTSAGSNPYNFVESLPSNEACLQLGKDVPIITNVSVLNTDFGNGNIEVRWSKPNARDLDTLLNPGPYRYEVWRAEGITNTGFSPIPGAIFDSSSFLNANDTIFTDVGLNTATKAYSYQIAFYVDGNFSEPIGTTNIASSVFLNVQGTDRKNILTWDVNVPWNNYEYIVYRQNNTTGVFDSLTTTNSQPFEDRMLENGTEYCYLIKTKGTYGIDGIIDPIYNLSQENCGIPIDSVAPCAPILVVETECELATDRTPSEEFQNLLTWTNPNNNCGDEGVRQYNIYYAINASSNFEIVETFNMAEDTTYQHQPEFNNISGCYYVTAIDTVNNESLPSNIVCVDNCPLYQLPNVFTPNQDGDNDLFIPFPHRFIERINLVIYNRWGQVVYETTDPDINWNGKNLNGDDLAEGTYFYTCEVFQKTLDGTLPTEELLNGYIHLIR